MSRLFISHSSQNNAETAVLRDWLAAEGWGDIFLDFDPGQGIAPGERWEEALSLAANRCQRILFFMSKAWLASAPCRREFAATPGYDPLRKLIGLIASMRSLGPPVASRSKFAALSCPEMMTRRSEETAI